jgi:hypothetical protein
VAACTAFSVSAETITVKPTYSFHGNICGTLNITSEIDRNIYVTVEQDTEDGNFTYYSTIVHQPDEDSEPDTYSFELEGKDDAVYKISITSFKYTGSDTMLSFETEFAVPNTDYITDEEVDGYVVDLSVLRDDSLAEPVLVYSDSEPSKDENNIYHFALSVAFPSPAFMAGDATNDGTIDVFDAILIAQYTVGKAQMTESQLGASDYNADGVIDVFDAIAVAKKTVE